MTQQELQQFISPLEINRGTLIEGADVEFEIINNSPYPFQCYEQSCGCLGTADLQPTSFKGALKAKGAGVHASTMQMLKAGDRYVQLHHTQAGPKFYDPINKEWVPNEQIPEQPEKVPVLNFHQTITLWFDDGEDFYKISPTGQLETNPAKSRVVIPIKFLVVKTPS